MGFPRGLCALGAALLGFVSSSALTASSAMAQDTAKPNILFVMTDDVAWMAPGSIMGA